MFQSKGHCLGGTDAIFEHKVTIHEDMPSIVLRVADAIGRLIPYEVRFRQLCQFDHYMSSGLVILKDKSWHDESHEAFLAQLRKWLGVTPLKEVEVWDHNAKQMVVQKTCFYAESDEYMMIPKPTAMTLFGPSALLPHVAKRPDATTPPYNSFGLKHDSCTLTFPIVNWHKCVPGITNINHPTLQNIFQKNLAAYEALNANVNPKKRTRVKVDHFQPHVPETILLPAPCKLTLLKRDDELLNSNLGFAMPDESQLTRPLTFIGRLRELPVDQLPIVGMSVVHRRRALMSVSSHEQAKLMTQPDQSKNCFCGIGKTNMDIAGWVWALDDKFDGFSVSDFEKASFCSDPANEHLRSQSNPMRTVKCLFVVHNTALMEQAAEDVIDIVPDARIGILQREKRPNPLECDIVIASTDTIAARLDIEPSFFDHFPLVIGDEAHQNKALIFVRAFRKITCLYKSSLTATPRFWLLPAVMGPVLIYIEPPYVEQTTNMIAYWAGDQIARTIKAGGFQKTSERLDIATQTSDLVMDMRRNMWLVFVSMMTTVIGKLASHGGFPPNLYTTLYDPLNTGRKTVLIQGRTLQSIMRKDDTAEDDDVDEDDGEPTDKRRKRKPAPSIEPVKGNLKDYFKSVAAAAKASPSAPVGAGKSNSKMDVDDPVLKMTAKTPSNAKHLQTRRVTEVQTPFDALRLKRNPIFFSTSINHLVMHQHWQAQYWIDTCTTIPKENLLIIRTNMRQLAVIDKTQLTAEQLGSLMWLGPGGFNFSSYSPITKVAVGAEGDFLKTRFGEEVDAAHQSRHFNAHFWREWFLQFPVNETQAEEDDVDSLNKSNKKRAKKAASTQKAESKHVNMSNQSVTAKLLAKIDAGIKTQQANSAAPIVASSSGDITEISNSKVKRKVAKKAATVPLKPKPSAAAEFEADCMPQAHASSNWIHRSCYFWTPMIAMPEVWRQRGGLWARETFINDKRDELPILATFGLMIGKTYPVPKPMKQKIKQAHVKDALASNFVFATYQIASIGINKPVLDTCIQGLTHKDDEQSDGRCQRVILNKQEFVKNEFVEPWSMYSSIAYRHHRVYKHQRRTVNYYRIEYE